MGTSASYTQWERHQKRIERERLAVQKAHEKQQRQEYISKRKEEAIRENEAITRSIDTLTTILRNGVERSARIDLASLRRQFIPESANLGSLKNPHPEPRWPQFKPALPGFIDRILGGEKRYTRALEAARSYFALATQQWQAAEQKRLAEIKRVEFAQQKKMEKLQQEINNHNTNIDKFHTNYKARDKQAVEEYLQQVLTAAPLPEKFPRDYQLTFNPTREQVVVQLELPPNDLVPTVKEVQYIQTKDELRKKPRPVKEIGALYRDVVSQVTLLSIRNLFNADPHLQSVGFNGHVWATNPATGNREYPCLISLDVNREAISGINFGAVDPAMCLRTLNALVSPHPFELEGVKPIFDFDKTKFSFIEGLDVVSTLDSRPDLLDMSPTEFEHLVIQLFEKMGLQGWTTTQSGDDGVDGVIVNDHPYTGGLAIVQAKRYTRVVGAAHLRELAGAMEEKKAGRGILVTTSWFASGCKKKALDHGRMQLIDGENLVHDIKKYLGKDVLIGLPKKPPSRK